MIHANRPRRPWLRALVLLLVLAATIHVLAVWAAPRWIMSRLLDVMAQTESGGVYLPPMTDASQRRVVMPSPDLLYAACQFDLSTRALRIRIDPGAVPLWSLALYASNSDNFFVLNDRDARGSPVDLLLLTPALRSSLKSLPSGTRTVLAPDARGLLMVRLLVGNYELERESLEQARQSLRCEPL